MMTAPDAHGYDGAMISELASPLSPTQCARALSEAVDSPWVFLGKKPVVGTVGEDGAVLRKRIKGRNSFQTLLKVKMCGRIDGTALSCRGGMSLAVAIFIGLWLGVVLAIGGAVFLASVAGLTGAGESEIPPALGLLVPPAMLAFGALLLTVGRTMAKAEEAFLLDFLTRTLQARPLTAGQARTATVS